MKTNRQYIANIRREYFGSNPCISDITNTDRYGYILFLEQKLIQNEKNKTMELRNLEQPK